MRIISSAIIISTLSLGSVFSQEPEIIGEIHDGTIQEAAPKPDPIVTPSRVIETVETKVNGRRVIFEKAEILEEEKNPKRSKRKAKAGDKKAQKSAVVELEDGGMYHVMSTCYFPRMTKLRWKKFNSTSDEWHEAVSNVPFCDIAGAFDNFKWRKVKYGMMVMNSSHNLRELRQRKRRGEEVEVPKVPSDLPRLQDGGPTFVMVEGSPRNREEMKFVRGLHRLYARKQGELRRAKRKRQEANRRQREEERNRPKEKKTLRVRFGKNS